MKGSGDSHKKEGKKGDTSGKSKVVGEIRGKNWVIVEKLVTGECFKPLLIFHKSACLASPAHARSDETRRAAPRGLDAAR